MNIRVESPFPFEALPRVYRWYQTFREKIADDFAPKTLDEFIQSQLMKWDQQQSWAIYGDGELGGLITFERINPWLGTATILLKPDFHGRGIAVKAATVAIGEMFQQPGIGKVDFFLLAGNKAIGSLLITIGAKREGTLESHTLREGKPADLWVYGLTKQHFEDTQNGILRGLLRSNHTDEHVERTAAV